MTDREEQGDTQGAVVGIGASAGGLEAIQEMFADAEAGNGLAYVLVQHLDPNHVSLMADLLSRRTRLPVRQISDGDRLAPDTILIIPPGAGLKVEDGCLRLVPFEEPRGLRRPIDDFFVSLAEAYKERAACVILSGTGADGTAGLRRIKELGGVAVAQEPGDARYDGMPASAVGTGLVDYAVLSEDIISTLTDYFDRQNHDPASKERAEEVVERLEDVCSLLQDKVGHDFSGYKHATMVRRIQRRMQVLGIDTAEEYVDRLREAGGECDALFIDVLINVTSFFRDPKAFEELRERVIEPLAANTPSSETIRIWIPGCSSGEEAYTIAMMMAYAMEDRQREPYVQIFATDIDEQMLAIAREAKYPSSALRDIPERYRDAYTIAGSGHFVIAPKVRDMVRLSSHSIIKDPPFSRLDLVSCRNMMIYMGQRLQDDLIPLFHYVLRPNAYLFMGPAEGIGRRDDLFQSVAKDARLYIRQESERRMPFDFPIGRPGGTGRQPVLAPIGERRNPSVQRRHGMAEQRLLESYAPTSLTVSQAGDIVDSSGGLARYFDMPMGQSTMRAVRLARGELKDPLMMGLRRAHDEKERTTYRDIEVTSEFGTQTVDLVVDPLPDGTALVVLRDLGAFRASTEESYAASKGVADEQQGLEDELEATRQRLRTTIEELETANEELKSSNEEMMSMNEELQSANEELTTVNEELKGKIDQLALANDDLSNFIESTDLALIIVDQKLSVRMFTEQAATIFPLRAHDRGRSLADFGPLVRDDDLLDDAERVAAGGEPVDRIVSSRDGRSTYAMRILPYRTYEGRMQGATLTFADVTELSSAEERYRREKARLEIALAATEVGVWETVVTDGDNSEAQVDPRTRQLFGLPEREIVTIGQVYDCIDPRDRPTVEAHFAEAAEKNIPYRATFRVRGSDPVRWLYGHGRLVSEPGQPVRMTGVNYDVSEAKEAEQTQALLLRELNHRVKNLFSVVTGIITFSGRSASTLKEGLQIAAARVGALARAHEVSQGQGDYATTELGHLVRLVLDPYMEQHEVELAGGEIVLPVDYTTPLGLILHEWATNAAKYGAFSKLGGSVHVEWKIAELQDGKAQAELSWTERGGPPVAEDRAADGFGARLVSQSVAQMDGNLVLDWRRSGFHARVTIPLEDKRAAER